MKNDVTAAVLIIGDEILSGRTKDKNIGFIAEYLTVLDIDLKEVRIVADDHEAIIEAVNVLRERYTYVFTTGGIGPTHDDITADAIARAFGRPIDIDSRALEILQNHYAMTGHELNAARLRMARIPQGAGLIENPVSKAPGFRLENVFVMAGVPAIMQAMMDNVAPTLERGRKLYSRSFPVKVGEGDIAQALADIEVQHKGVMVGSYPIFGMDGFSTEIVLRAKDPDIIEIASAKLEELLASFLAANKMKSNIDHDR